MQGLGELVAAFALVCQIEGSTVKTQSLQKKCVADILVCANKIRATKLEMQAEVANCIWKTKGKKK